MGNAGMTVSSFNSYVNLVVDHVEFSTPIGKLTKQAWTALYDKLDNGSIANSATSRQGIGNMVGEAVILVQYAGDAALGVPCVAVGK